MLWMQAVDGIDPWNKTHQVGLTASLEAVEVQTFLQSAGHIVACLIPYHDFAESDSHYMQIQGLPVLKIYKPENPVRCICHIH